MTTAPESARPARAASSPDAAGDDPQDPSTPPDWRRVELPARQRVADLVARMTLAEKCAQLYGVWVGADAEGGEVAPHMHENLAEQVDLEEQAKLGLGQLTRPFGTAPVDPALGALSLARTQRSIMAAGRFAIPALPHEECLAGFAAWGATIYPVPLAWGAAFSPELVGEMGARIGADLRMVGVYQGLAPVVDVVRDPRWGRVEETIGEDPCLVATIGAAYVRGLQSGGVVATLKHFAGYSGSVGARNHAPVRAGGRELADVILPPFEHAVRVAGARSVMQSYCEIDGLPAAADSGLLTGLLRDAWGFDGTVVSDYFGIGFLHSEHGVAADDTDAARQALAAGVDVELPTVRGYGARLVAAVEQGEIAESFVDRALWRVLMQKCELGLLDPDWSPVPPALGGAAAVAATARAEASGAGVDGRAEPAELELPQVTPGTVDLDSAANRALARRVAEESIVLLENRAGLLPLDPASPGRPGSRGIAVVGPLADQASAMLGCYSFPAHVGPNHPETPVGVRIPTVLESLRGQWPGVELRTAAGCEVLGPLDPDEVQRALTAAREADLCIAVLGDRAGLFGRGTSGEGCDAADLSLPGEQGAFLDALIETGTPIVLVLMTGRPYALGRYAGRLAAIVQAFFPGEEGGPAVASVLGGRVNPSGRLPVSVPRGEGGQPWTYLQPPLGLASTISSVDPTPLYPFGHGLSYTEFAWEQCTVSAAQVPVDGEFEVELTVRNTGGRDGSDVVQLYLHDPVAQTTRPRARLIGFAKVAVPAGEARRVRFSCHTDLTSFTGRAGRRIVEPGDIELWVAASSADEAVRHRLPVRLVGEVRDVDPRAPHRIAGETRISNAAVE
ncbi:glycoside hydrolase family 3 C-terminal domain-containing protein [Actinospica durhamensis]|uniref:Glycoside hydrolase family 3 C-terminal domain-containing protein n=1 Tax=Actinospica durhamensis TaxID=1508375 RepID=A0A941IQE5_9ACTN|nr:glycoside hydrolase family 3 N-terminal domain-containing protein [Actinospica durhamensis]MBR7832843.1 glycoside hydrolase family 3 C-terminal domain-containing protein [Actinospica durhamensis]